MNIYAFVVDYVKGLQRDQLLASTAMVYVHRYFRSHSLLAADPFVVAAACVFLAAKVRNSPVTIRKAIVAYFKFDNRAEPH